MLAEAMQKSGLEDMEVYIGRRNNTVAQYISTMPILDLLMEAERLSGERLSKWWG